MLWRSEGKRIDWRRAGRLLPVTKIGLVRSVTASLALLTVVSGAVGAIRYGGICTLDIQQILTAEPLRFVQSALAYNDIELILAACPLGFLERSIASRELLPQLWLPVALVALSVILLGRVFCAWVCPASLVSRTFRITGGSRVKWQAGQKGVDWASYSPYAVLAGVLAASFLFRFPVFCFFCPVGLAFASVFAVVRLFSPDPLGVEIVLFPALLGLELFALKSWCRSFCPLGAMLRLAGSLNHFLRPAIKPQACLVNKGIDCQACRNACPEGVDLRNQKTSLFLKDCTKCLECYERCPARAIRIAVLS